MFYDQYFADQNDKKSRYDLHKKNSEANKKLTRVENKVSCEWITMPSYSSVNQEENLIPQPSCANGPSLTPMILARLWVTSKLWHACSPDLLGDKHDLVALISNLLQFRHNTRQTSLHRSRRFVPRPAANATAAPVERSEEEEVEGDHETEEDAYQPLRAGETATARSHGEQESFAEARKFLEGSGESGSAVFNQRNRDNSVKKTETKILHWSID